jgi:organic hydroperoxide reductase OsmC/OhrA
MNKQHHYHAKITWEGNTGEGTQAYTSYKRDYQIELKDKPIIHASADPAFKGDAGKLNPEEMLLSALSSCHMLWFLHECADHGIIVESYVDDAKGLMEEQTGQGGRFEEVILQPIVVIRNSEHLALSLDLHESASNKCFIKNSCNFPVLVDPKHETIKEH